MKIPVGHIVISNKFGSIVQITFFFFSPIIVGFIDCTDRTRFAFISDDSRFTVLTDGQVIVSKVLILDCKTYAAHMNIGGWKTRFDWLDYKICHRKVWDMFPACIDAQLIIVVILNN